MAMMVLGVMVIGVVSGFLQSERTAEWAAYSLAAQSLALQPVEQARGSKWDPYATPAVDQIVAANFPARTEILDIPISGTNIVYATNRTSIRLVSTNPPLKEIYVECTWRFFDRGLFTNSVLTYRAPDQ